MYVRGVKWASALMLFATMPMYVGCACKGTRTAVATETTTSSVHLASNRLDADEGECFAMVFTPPRFDTVSEKVCIREASERLEVIPAEYAWVDEKVLVKDAYTEIEVVPVRYGTETRTVEVEPGHSGWVKENAECADQAGNPVVSEVYCFEKQPPKFKTVSFQTVSHEAECREKTIPAEYQTVRRQKLVRAASTRRITIPAEYETVVKTVQVADGRMDWQQVMCKADLSTTKINQIETSLLAAGYNPGNPDGDLAQTDWVALRRYQEDNGLGVGALTVQTLASLGVQTD